MSEKPIIKTYIITLVAIMASELSSNITNTNANFNNFMRFLRENRIPKIKSSDSEIAVHWIYPENPEYSRLATDKFSLIVRVRDGYCSIKSEELKEFQATRARLRVFKSTGPTESYFLELHPALCGYPVCVNLEELCELNKLDFESARNALSQDVLEMV